jgi:hypothetical protein
VSLGDELRAQRPQVIADCMEAAEKAWAGAVESMRRAASLGSRKIRLMPKNNDPAGRATTAAVAVRAEAEGLKVTRFEEPASMWSAGGPVWEVSW